MKKSVTPESKPPIPDVWFLVTTSQTESGFAVARYDSSYGVWFCDEKYLPVNVMSYFPTPLNELE